MYRGLPLQPLCLNLRSADSEAQPLNDAKGATPGPERSAALAPAAPTKPASEERALAIGGGRLHRLADECAQAVGGGDGVAGVVVVDEGPRPLDALSGSRIQCIQPPAEAGAAVLLLLRMAGEPVVRPDPADVDKVAGDVQRQRLSVIVTHHPRD